MGYRVKLGGDIDQLYAGGATLFDVNKGTTYLSPSLRKGRVGMVDGESTKGTTHMIYTVSDFVAGGMGTPGIELPSVWHFISLVENRRGVGLLSAQGPVYCIPPVSAMGQSKPPFSFNATAPTLGTVTGTPFFDEDLTSGDDRPLCIVMPFPATDFSVRNVDDANDLYVAFGHESQFVKIGPGEDIQVYSGEVKSLIFGTTDAGGCDFSIHGVMKRGA